jgi:acyl transferase domain-containing protein
VVGHSVGEVSAAYVSGMLSLRDAVLVAYHRARLQATTAGSGGMLAVGMSPEQARGLVGDDPRVDIAAINSASSLTLSGEIDRLDEIAEKLTEDGIFARRLRVEVPYHSRLMDPILDELRAALAGLEPKAPTVPLYSSVTGERVTGPDWNAEYWCANVREPVRFADAVTELIAADSRVFLEVGPHPVLSGNIRETLLGADVNGTTVPTLDRKQPDSESLRRTLIGLYAAGVLDLDELFPAREPATPHVPLPRYPWQRTRLHSALPLFEQARLGSPGTYAMLGDPDVEGRPDWLLQVGTELLPWLADHVVNGIKIMPGAAYLDAALSATASRLGVERVALEQVRFVAPLIMGAPDVPLVALTVEEASGRFLIRSRSATGTAWTVHAFGRTLTGSHKPTKVTVPTLDVGLDVDPQMFYTGLAAAGLQYGPAFRRVTSVRVGADAVVATVDGTIAADSGHLAHPAVVDAAMQSAALLFADARIDEGTLVRADHRGRAPRSARPATRRRRSARRRTQPRDATERPADRCARAGPGSAASDGRLLLRRDAGTTRSARSRGAAEGFGDHRDRRAGRQLPPCGATGRRPPRLPALRGGRRGPRTRRRPGRDAGGRQGGGHRPAARLRGRGDRRGRCRRSVDPGADRGGPRRVRPPRDRRRGAQERLR